MIDRQKDRQTEGQIDRGIDIWKDRQKNRQIETRKKDRQIEGQMETMRLIQMYISYQKKYNCKIIDYQYFFIIDYEKQPSFKLGLIFNKLNQVLYNIPTYMNIAVDRFKCMRSIYGALFKEKPVLSKKSPFEFVNSSCEFTKVILK